MHVLIVEDEKKMAELLKSGLEEENHSVSLAFDGRDALEMAQKINIDEWRREVLMQDELFMRIYAFLPKEIIFQRELLVARL